MEHKQADVNWTSMSLVQANLNFSHFRKDNESKWLSNKIFPVTRIYILLTFLHSYIYILTLCKKCPNTEFLLVRISLYSVRIQENTDQKNSVFRHFSRSVSF